MNPTCVLSYIWVVFNPVSRPKLNKQDQKINSIFLIPSKTSFV